MNTNQLTGSTTYYIYTNGKSITFASTGDIHWNGMWGYYMDNGTIFTIQ